MRCVVRRIHSPAQTQPDLTSVTFALAAGYPSIVQADYGERPACKHPLTKWLSSLEPEMGGLRKMLLP